MNVGIGLSVSNFSSVPTVGLDLDAAIAALFSSGEEGAWYDPSDLTTLYQDAAGTTPVTGTGQPVGLMLDKSKGLTLGAELVTNGTFDTDTTGWVGNNANATLTWQSGSTALFENVADFAYVRTSASIALTAGKWYRVSFDLIARSHPSAAFHVGLGVSGNNIGSPGSYSYLYKATGPAEFQIRPNAAGIGTAVFDNISIRELPGNHATQSTSTARPTLQVTGTTPATLGSELVTNGTFDTASDWTLGTGWTISGGVAAFAPGTGSLLSQSGTFASSRTYAISFDISLNGSCSMTVQFSGGGGSDTAGLLSFGSGSHTVFVSTTIARSVIGFSATAVSDFTIDNISVKEVLTWADPKYYLDFDGVDDFLDAPDIAGLEGIPEMSVCLGAAIPSGTAQQSPVSKWNDGTLFSWLIDYVSATSRFFVTTGVSGGIATFNVTRDDSVNVSIYRFKTSNGYLDINGASVSPSSDTIVATVTRDNNAVVTIGAKKDGATVAGFFSGPIYGLIIRSADLDVAELAATEAYLATKSGVTLP